MKKNSTDLALLAVASALLVVLGTAFVTIYLIMPSEAVDPSIKKIAIIVGAAFAVIGILLLLFSCVKISKKRRAKRNADEAFRRIQNEVYRQKQEEQRAAASALQVDEVVIAGKQPIGEKFAEIAKMDKSQFVFYIARLFALKGYGIRFTAVVDNFGIDLLLNRGEKIYGVACFLSQKAIPAEDVAYLQTIDNHYRTDGIFAVTNNFFERSALEIFKKSKITVVDKNVLSDEYMK